MTKPEFTEYVNSVSEQVDIAKAALQKIIDISEGKECSYFTLIGRIKSFGCEIIIVNECEDKEDLFEDFVSLVTSFCDRIYGRRRTKRKTEQIIKTLQKEDDSNDSS